MNRAIELLSLPDSMCRIAAQSTILNVYKVIDRRSREYALQDEMIQKMFAAVVFIMHSQYEKMAESTIAYMEVSFISNAVYVQELHSHCKNIHYVLA